MDGIPLHKNSQAQFWSILMSIHEKPQAPVMTVAIYHGDTKPKNLEEYLGPMVRELNSLTANGLMVNKKHLAVKLRAIIADTPARALIKGVKGHGGYNGCQKCTVRGVYSKETHRMIYPGTNAVHRTDYDFRNGTYPGHVKMSTPLLQLEGFDMIQDMVVAERLHLIDQGIMKRMLVGWRSGSLGRVKLCKVQCGAISTALSIIQLPSEIHRTVRGMHWAHALHSCITFPL